VRGTLCDVAISRQATWYSRGDANNCQSPAAIRHGRQADACWAHHLYTLLPAGVKQQQTAPLTAHWAALGRQPEDERTVTTTLFAAYRGISDVASTFRSRRAGNQLSNIREGRPLAGFGMTLAAADCTLDTRYRDCWRLSLLRDVKRAHRSYRAHALPLPPIERCSLAHASIVPLSCRALLAYGTEGSAGWL